MTSLCLFSSAAQDYDIIGKTTTFEAAHKECIRVLPYELASGQFYVQLYVFCDKDGIPEELKAAAQDFFKEVNVELRWTNLFDNASNKPNIVSEDFKQLEESQVNFVSKIINKNLPVFSKHRNITAIQPSLKVTNSEQKNDPCIRVYVLGKGCIPFGESKIPNSVEDCPVEIVDGFWYETLDTPKPLVAHKQEKYLRLGASIGVKGKGNAGTLGAIVKDERDNFYLLSCDHVLKHEEHREIIHPGWCHYLNSLDYHLIDYQNWIYRITGEVKSLQHSDPKREDIFKHLRKQVDLFCDDKGVLRHKKLRECESKLYELFSEPPRTVAHWKRGIRKGKDVSKGSEVYFDVAIAELTEEEKNALEKNGYIEIIDTANYSDDKMDLSQNHERVLHKSGSGTGYTSLKSSIVHKDVFLRNPEHRLLLLPPKSPVIPSEDLRDGIWCKNCLLFENDANLFSYFGDSGAVIFEKCEQQTQPMAGFGIVFAGLFSNDKCVGTIAVRLRSALEILSKELGSNLTLVSKLETPLDQMDCN